MSPTATGSKARWAAACSVEERRRIVAASRTACFNLLYFYMHTQGLSAMLKASGVRTGDSGGSMNRGSRAAGAPDLWNLPPSYRVVGPQKKNLGKTFRQNIKIVATRCRILRLKCIKFDFGWGSAPDPAGGAYCAPQTT